MLWVYSKMSPDTRARMMRWSTYSSVVIGMLYMWPVLKASLADRKPLKERRAEFVSWCIDQDQSVAACEGRLKENHDDCYTSSGGGIGETSRFDTERYQSYTFQGVDVWKQTR